MSTLELKKELHQIIDNSDTNLVEGFYAIITAYIEKSKNSQMIAESEEDIKSGRIHNQNEVRKIIESWKYGFDKAIQIALKLQKGTEILENSKYDFSEIGSIDAEFAHLKRNYRKLIDGHFKITYREGKTKIYINRIFDTRQNPNKNK